MGTRRRLRAAPAVLAIAAALLVAVPGPAAGRGPTKPRAGHWTGDIGAFRVSFTVSRSGDRITDLRTDYEATGSSCGPPSSAAPTVQLFRSLVVRNGSFSGVRSITQPSGIVMRFTVHGKVRQSTRITGTLNEFFLFPNNSQPPCNETDPLSAMHARS